MNKLTASDKETKLKEFFESGWKLDKNRDAISKEFQFKNFIEAFSWMTKIAFWAEKINHHPEWFNVYRTVKVVLTTHDVQGLSSLDLELAAKMDSEAG